MATQILSRNFVPESPSFSNERKGGGGTQLASLPIAFYSFRTSAKRINTARGQISTKWEPLSEEDAVKFINTVPARDSRQNFTKSRFHVLVVQYPSIAQLYEHEALLKAAKARGWMSKGFEAFTRNQTAGSAVQDSANGLSLIAQTPQDDTLPFFSLCLTSHRDLGYEDAPDWSCLVFLWSPSTTAKPVLDVNALTDLLNRDPFPSDYHPPLSPDFMVLPVSLLRWQVDEIAERIATLKKQLTNVDEEVLKTVSFDMKALRRLKFELFEMRRMHRRLHQRYVFAKEFAANLERAFEKLKKRSNDGTEEFAIEYSATLKETLQAQIFHLKTLKHDIKTTPQRIEAQQTMMDGQTSIMIARNSDLAAEEARRDSASMKTVAIVTLVFLPGTFLAAIFSMSMFQWLPDNNSGDSGSGEGSNDDKPQLSNWFWLYWVITVPLTVVILIVWIVWYRWSDNKYKKKRRREIDEEGKIK